jgi:2-polyprenyl-3-methyl-5-hydroxy-6-metoxy-1,4-benzoquinol methylase
LYYTAIRNAYRLKHLVRGVRVLNSERQLRDYFSRVEEKLAENPDFDFLSQCNVYYQPSKLNPVDPQSDKYLDEQKRLYEFISERSWGAFEEVAQDSGGQIESWRQLYPFSTRSAAISGQQLMTNGFWLKCVDIQKNSKIIEFGSGCGDMALYLSALGHDVLATDISLTYINLIKQKAAIQNLPLRTQVAAMDKFSTNEKFDMAFFCEAFHHSADHVGTLRMLSSIIKPGGKVYLFGEPITQFPYPWGLRTDGESLWMAKKHGWLELGFDKRYFRALAEANGWHMTSERNKHVSHGSYAICLTRKIE